MFSIHARMVFRVIIFCSVWFLPIKTTKLKFYKIYKKPKPNQTKPVSIRFGYFILKTENYIVFWGFFRLSNGFFLVWFIS